MADNQDNGNEQQDFEERPVYITESFMAEVGKAEARMWQRKGDPKERLDLQEEATELYDKLLEMDGVLTPAGYTYFVRRLGCVIAFMIVLLIYLFQYAFPLRAESLAIILISLAIEWWLAKQCEPDEYKMVKMHIENLMAISENVMDCYPGIREEGITPTEALRILREGQKIHRETAADKKDAEREKVPASGKEEKQNGK
jgi:hypothetical protein